MSAPARTSPAMRSPSFVCARRYKQQPRKPADGRIIGILREDDFAAKKRPVPFSTLRLPSVLGQWLRDSIEQVYAEARVMRAADVMSRHVFTVRAEDPVETAVRIMCEQS